MKRAALFATILLGLAACNTLDGVGQDIQAGAQALDNTF